MKFFLIPFILIPMFFVSIFDMPYWFYTLSRVVVFLLSDYFVFLWITLGDEISAKLIPIIAIIILWNPLIPIPLGKEIWIVLDICAIVVEFITGIFAYRSYKNI